MDRDLIRKDPDGPTSSRWHASICFGLDGCCTWGGNSLETSLHQQLKQLYAAETGQTEVVINNFRIDAIAADGELIEIQFNSLASLRRKVECLLPARSKHRLRIVKPIVARKRVTTLSRRDGQVIRSRMSPKTCDWLDFFIDFVFFCRTFPRRRLSLEVVLVEVEEIRVDRIPKRRRGKSYRTLDVQLVQVSGSRTLHTASDVMDLLSIEQWPNTFTTNDLAIALDRPRWFAQRVAYCMRAIGTIEAVSRRKHGQIYMLTKRRSGSSNRPLRKGA